MRGAIQSFLVIAGGEGAETGVVEVRPLAIRSIGSNPLLDLLPDSL
jgi:hypothetical protein